MAMACGVLPLAVVRLVQVVSCWVPWACCPVVHRRRGASVVLGVDEQSPACCWGLARAAGCAFVVEHVQSLVWRPALAMVVAGHGVG